MSENDHSEAKDTGRDDVNPDSGETDRQETSRSPVKEMFLLALLYLPLGFFLWFFFASALMFPVARVSELLLTGLFPDIFERIVQLDFTLEIQTLVTMAQQVEGRTAMLNLHVNPMIYAWGMALLFGLVMATPLSAGRRALQLLVAYVVVALVTVWGVFWETWASLAFRSGSEAAEVARESALQLDMVALFYQLGYLMFPAVVPIATWILMNSPFIEMLVQRKHGDQPG